MKEFVFKKKYGQNFLTDKNLLASICSDAGIESSDEVLEIGAGMGALTKPLCERAKKVVSYEIDTELEQYLQSLNCDNLILHFKDALKKDLAEIEKDFSGKYKLVANLPYYITSPLIFKFLSSKKISSLTVMVQKEVGERITAKVGDKEYGLLSVSCAFFGEAKIMRKVPRSMFKPQPEVDSCIVKIEVEKNKFSVSEETFFKVVKAAFKSRRKTLLNNLSEGLNASKSAFGGFMQDLSKRAEMLSVQDFVSLTKQLQERGLV